jgi:hypothetical protein
VKPKLVASILFFTVQAALASPLAKLSPDFVNPTNGHTYFLLTTGNWQDSEASAVFFGGHLVTINDAPEQAWVFSTFSTYNSTPRSLWIGLTDKDSEGNFTWVSNELTGYSNWRSGEPNNNNANEDYVHMHAPTTLWPGEWNDVDSAVQFPTHDGFTPHGVVEVVPEPTTLSLVALSLFLGLLIKRGRTQWRV